MTRTYELFVETGPQRKSTSVYVIDLLGCVLFRRTADQAIADAADEIRAYLGWLRGHGEKVDPDAPFTTRMKHESTAGGFIGSARSEEDLAPLTATEVERYARWLEWGRADLLALVEGIAPGASSTSPRPAARSAGPRARARRGQGLRLLGVPHDEERRRPHECSGMSGSTAARSRRARGQPPDRPGCWQAACVTAAHARGAGHRG